MNSSRFQLMVVVILLLGFGGSATAQTSKGFVVGAVEDQNGASIPNATVKITNLKTGVVRNTVADSAGSFRIDAVDPGTYSLKPRAKDSRPANLTGSKSTRLKQSTFRFGWKSEALMKK